MSEYNDAFHISKGMSMDAWSSASIDNLTRGRCVGFFGFQYVDDCTELLVRKRIRRHLEILYSQGYRAYFVGAGKGFSQLVLEELVVMQEQKNGCVIVLEPAGCLFDERKDLEQERYRILRKQASYIIRVTVNNPEAVPCRLNEQLFQYCGCLVYYADLMDEDTEQTVHLAEERCIQTERLASLYNDPEW